MRRSRSPSSPEKSAGSRPAARAGRAGRHFFEVSQLPGPSDHRADSTMKICHVMVDFHCRPLHDRGRYGSARIAGAMIHRSMQARPIRAIHMQARPILATGALLAGGRGQRLGRDKVLAELAGRPLALWVLDALAPCVSEVLICIDRPERASELDGLDLSRATRAGKPRMEIGRAHV